MKKISIFVLISFILISLWLVFHHPSNESDNSMYFRDTLNIRTLVCESDTFWVDQNYSIRDWRIYHNNPDSIVASDLHPNIYYVANNDTNVIKLNVRCWKYGEPYLQEQNKTNKIGLFLNKVHKYYHNHFGDSISFSKAFYNPVLLTKDNITYYVENGQLKSRNLAGVTQTIAEFILEDPIYNQMLVEGNFGVIRSGHKIWFSDDSLANWKTVYQGPRAIKESMFWNGFDSTLVFTQYTPGKIRNRHYVLRYSYKTDQVDTLKTFYRESEFRSKGLDPCARHIHVLTLDPYTGWLFLGTGDTDLESGIYVSKDNGQTFICLGRGKQVWRTLAFIFTPDYILWNTDSHEPQYLSEISRKDLNELPIAETKIMRIPVLNSALWCTLQTGDMTIMTSNVEGALYDNNRRIFGIKVADDGNVEVLDLWHESGKNWSSQLLPTAIDNMGNLQFFDTEKQIYRTFKLMHGE